jgi:hypothetical protein
VQVINGQKKSAAMNDRNYIYISFSDEEPLLQAVRKLLASNETILDVRSPFPVHGLEKLLSIKRSRIPVGGFILGALGAIFAFSFMAWVFTVSYPLIIGGKPFFSVPTFIPITFEVTVLFTGISMATALLVRSKLKPDIRFEPVDEKITDDMFVILIDSTGGKTSLEKIRSILSDIQTIEIR